VINITINDIPVSVEEGSSILAAAKEIGIDIPNLCYLEGINEIGACRLCLVEVEGLDYLVPSCNTEAEEGMKIKTNTQRVHQARRMNTQMILSEHNDRCPTCERSGNCSLQTLSNILGIYDSPFHKKEIPEKVWNQDVPLIRDETRCIKCMRCVSFCEKVQNLGIWDIADTGKRTTVGVTGGKPIEKSDCSLCGQCITHCPVGALHERDDSQKAFEYIGDPEVVTVVQVAPAVRVAWGDTFAEDSGFATEKRLVAGLKKLGFDYVFDTNFTADLTIMEEGSELIERITNKDDHKWPMYTSCCPGWVRFAKAKYPDMLDNLSTAKSPQQMFGAVTKTWFAEKIGITPDKIRCVSIMPCTAKKHECAIPVLKDACGDPDVDIVLTTREVNRMLRADFIDVSKLGEEEFDSPLGESTGAAVIFGTQGGVMEAALRSAYYLITGENPPADAFADVRVAEDAWTEATFHVNELPVRVAIASGLENSDKLISAIRRGEKEYDFVEIMACPGGCAGGGGQPFQDSKELAKERGKMLHALDENASMRYSHENPAVHTVYEEYFEKPLSEKSHHLLHTDHHAWEFSDLTYVNR